MRDGDATIAQFLVDDARPGGSEAYGNEARVEEVSGDGAADSDLCMTASVLMGNVEAVTATEITGWAWNPQAPDHRLRIEIGTQDEKLADGVAHNARDDLLAEGIGDGSHGFRIALSLGRLPAGRHVVYVRCVDTGAAVPGSPVFVDIMPQEPAVSFEGHLDDITEHGITGWISVPTAPSLRCVVALMEAGQVLARAKASEFRADLQAAGVGDGCYAFSLPLPPHLLDGETHVLDVVETSTGHALNHEPISWRAPPTVTALQSDETAALVAGQFPYKPGAEAPDWEVAAGQWTVAPWHLAAGIAETDPGAFGAIVADALAGERRRHTLTRGDVARLQTLARHLPRFPAILAREAVLALTDCIHRTATTAAAFFTDTMLGVWLAEPHLQARFPRLETAVGQYAYLAWYLCVRPLESGCVLSREPPGPVLAAMAAMALTDTAEDGIGCTAIMLAAWCYTTSFPQDALPPPSSASRQIVRWFICQGAYDMNLLHTVPYATRHRIAGMRLNGLALPVAWAMESLADAGWGDEAPERKLARLSSWCAAPGPQRARIRHLVHESLVASGYAHFDDPPQPALPAFCTRLATAVADRSGFLLRDDQPAYVSTDGDGTRLLLDGEWNPVEPLFVWSRVPLSSLLFAVETGSFAWVRIGLLFNQAQLPERTMRIRLNHNLVWSGTVGDAGTDELVICCTERCVAAAGLNLLQVEIDRAFIPSLHSGSSDSRSLGIGLRRIWIQRGGVAA